jgi:hypothetical protein
LRPPQLRPTFLGLPKMLLSLRDGEAELSLSWPLDFSRTVSEKRLLLSFFLGSSIRPLADAVVFPQTLTMHTFDKNLNVQYQMSPALESLSYLVYSEVLFISISSAALRLPDCSVRIKFCTSPSLSSC